MKNLTTKLQIAGAKKTLKAITKKFYRVNKKCKDALIKKGFEQIELGTGPKQYITSQDISIITTPDKIKYLAYGICNYSVRGKNGISIKVYRAFVKQIQA